MAASSSCDRVAGVRKELRQLRENIVDIKNTTDFTSTTSNALGKVIDQANCLFDVSKTDSRGSAIDASILNHASRLGAEQAQNLQQKTPDTFIRQLLAKCACQPPAILHLKAVTHAKHICPQHPFLRQARVAK